MHRPTAENLVPIRLDIEIEGQRYKDALTWNPSGNFKPNLFLFLFIHCRWLNSNVVDPDSEVVVFAKRTAKDLKLPPVFVTQIAQSIQVNTLHQWFFPFHSRFNELFILYMHQLFILVSIPKDSIFCSLYKQFFFICFSHYC